MRKFMFISLLLLSILVDHQAQGTRLLKGSLSAKQYKAHDDKSELSRSDLSFGEVMNPTLESHGSESGSSRKLMTETFSTSSTTTTSKNDKNIKNDHQGKNNADPILKGQSISDRLGEKQENFSVNSLPLTQHPPETAPDHYPDILDIAGMDYSPARRKPPIHN